MDKAITTVLRDVLFAPLPLQERAMVQFPSEPDHNPPSWALLVVGRVLRGTHPVEQVRSFDAWLREELPGNVLQAIPSNTPRPWNDASHATVVIGRILATCTSTDIPCGPYRASDLAREAQMSVDDLSTIRFPETWEFETDAQMMILASGLYASAYAVAGTIEPSPVSPTSTEYPELFRDPSIHVHFRKGALTPRFLLRGTLLAAANTASPLAPLSNLSDSDVFLQLRIHEDGVQLGKPRQIDSGLLLSSLNHLPVDPCLPPPHTERRSVAAGAVRRFAPLSRLLAPLKRTHHFLEKLARVEGFLVEYMPDVYESMGLAEGATTEQRHAVAEQLGLAALPELVDVLLGWHDGQTGSQGLVEERLDLCGWTLLSCAGIIEVRAGSSDLHAWEPSFLPLFKNGSGDYLVTDTKRRSDRLLEWRHDDPDEPVRAACVQLDQLPTRVEGWYELYEESRWSSVNFDVDSLKARDVHHASFFWTNFLDLPLGSLLLAESDTSSQAMLLASRTSGLRKSSSRSNN